MTAMNYSTIKHTTALLKSLAKLRAVLKLVLVLGKHYIHHAIISESEMLPG